LCCPEGDAAVLAAAFALSSSTVRYFHPDAEITLLTDEQTRQRLPVVAHDPAGGIDVRSVRINSGGPKYRSRMLKTNLHHYLGGGFVYLDIDTAAVAPLDQMGNADADLALTIDCYFTDKPGLFPSWLTKHYQALGWRKSSYPYLNSGVMAVAKTAGAAALFAAWHTQYQAGLREGLNMDQPALNHAILTAGPRICILPETWNFFCGRQPRRIPEDTKILHVCRSRPNCFIPAYERLLASAAGGRKYSGEEIVAELRGGMFQHSSRFLRFREWLVRSREFLFRTALGARFHDGSRE